MVRIEWNDDWATGIENIDEQHKYMLSILEKIQVGGIKPLKLIEELVEYTANHFSDEEALMSKNNYPKELFDAHKKEHNKFKRILLDISFKIMEDNAIAEKIDQKLESFCFIWFRLHVTGTDKILAEFLKGGKDKIEKVKE